jgi:hypothetical protein
VREIRLLRAMWRVLETGSRKLLTGHEDGNVGYRQGALLRITAPALDPTTLNFGVNYNSPGTGIV